MVRSTGVQIGLFAFTVALVTGLYVGNSATVVLTRALVAMVAAAVVGQLAAWATRLVLRDHLQRKKSQVDREHLAALDALSDDDPPDAPQEPVEVG